MTYHQPVLLNESIEGLNIRPKGSYADLTFGGGGHSREVLKKLGKNGRLLAFDQDPDAAKNVFPDQRLTFIQANFRYLKHFLRYHGIDSLDGILADLGISSHQIDEPHRGFSFRSEQDLDMRMNPEAVEDASHVLNKYSSEQLTTIFREYGELNNAGRIARAVVKAREEQPITTSSGLQRVLEGMIPAKQQSKFLARVYQALRLEVNQEMDALKELLDQTLDVLNPGGRLVVITYHSLEDRLVKNFMKSGNLGGQVEKDFYGNVLTPWKLINRNVIVPSEKELSLNSRSRSAKLRIAEKI
jgi:16S rRNA (cytosine1402-N4)-methyltransferase